VVHKKFNLLIGPNNVKQMTLRHFLQFMEAIVISDGLTNRLLITPLPRLTRKNRPNPKYFIAKTDMIFVCAIKLGTKMQENAPF